MSDTTQNGYPIDPPRRDFTIPGTSKTVSLISSDDALILMYILGRWHAEVEDITGSDTAGYDARPIGGLGGTTSNHRSGTAVDILSASTYPAWTDPDAAPATSGEISSPGDGDASPAAGTLRTPMTKAVKVALIRSFFAAVGGMARWGYDWGDEQHIELTLAASGGGAAAIVAQIKAGTLPNVHPSLTTPGAVSGVTSGTGDATEDASGNPLAQIAGLPSITPIALVKSSGVSKLNRLDAVRIAGLQVTSELSQRVTTARMEYSSTQVGQLSLTVQDTPAAKYFGSGLFNLGTSIDFANQHMDLRTVTFSGSAGAPIIELAARSRVIAQLRGPKQSGPGTWGEVDIQHWVIARVTEAGGRAVTQALGSQTISRQAGGEVETTWDVMVRLATLLGVWCFEYDQTVVFAKPSFLVNMRGHRGWQITWQSWSNYSQNLLGLPSYSNTYDADGTETLEFGLVGPDNWMARPGDFVRYTGPGAAAGNWIITSVNVDVVEGAAVQVTCDRVIDPTIPPPAVTADDSSVTGGAAVPGGASTPGTTPATGGGGAPGSAVDKFRATVAKLAEWGIVVKEQPGCWTANNGTDWNPGGPFGHVHHHFVTDMDPAHAQGCVDALRNGYDETPGPVVNWFVDVLGNVYLISTGPANHSGQGNSGVLSRVKNRQPPQGPAATLGLPNDFNGNQDYIGTETQHPGDATPYPDALIASLVAVTAAEVLCFGFSSNAAIMHYEHTDRKIDMSWLGGPASNTAGDTLRSRVAARAIAGSPGAGASSAAPAPPPPRHANGTAIPN